MHRKYIITGGPCTGKTTLIEELKRLGYPCYDEVARQVILEQKALGSDTLPWLNLEKFSREVLNRMLQQYASPQPEADICFCDRGIPDIIAYLENSGLAVHPDYTMHVSSASYHHVVFIAPPWRAIYQVDDVRTEDFETSDRLYTFLRKAYTDRGFEITELPRISPEERAAFILASIEKHNMR